MVYDNYNALVVGFGPSERASEAVVSLAIFPKWVTLCFLQNGPRIRIGESAERIGECRPSCAARFGGGSRQARDQTIDPRGAPHGGGPDQEVREGRMVIKSVSEKQRPRRLSRV